MALQLRNPLFLFGLLLLPVFATCFRPFRVPKSLFVQGTSPFTLPEGAREIQQEDHQVPLEDHEELEADISWSAGAQNRIRRDAGDPTPAFSKSDLPTDVTGKMHLFWVSGSSHEKYIILLAKSTKGDKSTVLLSTDHGKNFTNINNRFTVPNSTQTFIDQVYIGQVDPSVTKCIFADKVNKKLFLANDLMSLKFNWRVIPFEPSFITFHPWVAKYVMAYDSPAQKLYLSSNNGLNFQLVSDLVKSFQWGVKGVDKEETIFVEKLKTKGGNVAEVLQFDNGRRTKQLIDNVEEFELMKNYLFVTIPKKNGSSPKMMVSYNRTSFKEAKFPLTEENRDFFVFDIIEDFVFVVINHQKNSSNMYLADSGGINYQLSLERVLYHNPFTDVSSPWLRSVIPYAFVDVLKVKAMRGTYVATQLTPGPVGKRHLLSLITYNRGGKWQKIPSPAYDNRGGRINCYLPDCSLHMNLMYGAVYRVSPSQQLLSTEAAPGLVVALGVASTNLKIYPNLYVSLDGAVAWQRVLRGKHLFDIGDNGGVIVAVSFGRFTRTLKYSIDGGRTWKNYVFSTSVIMVRDLVTQPGERLPIFLIYGNPISSAPSGFKPWVVFSFNLTSVLGPPCDSSGYTTWTDGCLLGRQQQFETRNWTISCRTGREYERPKVLKNCPCGRDDFECDFGFQRKAVDEECSPILGQDLDKEIIPDNCPEGTNYNRTQGFRKIPGDTCVNGSEADFSPKLTPCPVKELVNLTVRCDGSKDGVVAVVKGGSVSCNASLGRGYYPNIVFKWYFGDKHTADGTGKSGATQSHQYLSPGKYVVSVVASNLRSTLVEKIDLYVQEKLDKEKVIISFNPKNPGVKEDVTFFAILSQLYDNVGVVKYKWKFEGLEAAESKPVVTHQFSKSAKFKVDLTISNLVSTAKKVVEIEVTKDLIPQNVTAEVRSPTKVLVKWEHPVEADKYIKEYKIFTSTSNNAGYHLAKTVDKTVMSYTVDKLIPATTYYFKVLATTETESGPFSQAAVAKTSTSTPGAPNTLRAFAISVTSIMVTWSEPTSPNGMITGYTIKYWSSSDPRVKTVNNRLSKSKNFTNLPQNTFYYFEVVATNDQGPGITAGPVQAQTKLSKPNLPPRNIEMLTENGTCALVAWEPPFLSLTDNRTFPVKGYKIRVDNKPDVDTHNKHAFVCDLSPGAKYDVFVSAYSQVGAGPEANITISTQVTKADAPTNLKAEALSSSEIRLSWTSPAQKISGYVLYQVSPPPEADPNPVNARLTTFIVQKLQPYTEYQFVIVAKNSLGLGVKSSTATATTLQSRPDKVEFVSAEVIKPFSASIQLTWTKPSKPNGVITQYKIEWGKVKQSDMDKFQYVKYVNGTTTSYTFKHLISSTWYAFAVTPRSRAGEGLNHVEPAKERTQPALKGTERLHLDYSGPEIDENNIEKDFKPHFIKAVSSKGNVVEDRIAAVDVRWQIGAVEFDLLPPLDKSGVPVEKAKSALKDGFDITNQWKVKPQSLRRLFVYSGDQNGVLPTKGKPSAGQQKGSPEAGSSSKRTLLGIAIPLTLIGIALLAGMIFFYMKYKKMENNYRKVTEGYAPEEDEMKVVYHEPMQADSPDSIFGGESRKGKKFMKDPERVPLEENDELAII